MTNCLLCGRIKSLKRKKYCSIQCVKRAWYIRNNPNIKGYFVKNPEFWKTETGIGFKWEKWAAKVLGAKHLKFNNRGGDLDWNGKIVDVKSTALTKRKFKRGKPIRKEQKGYWCFNRGEKKKMDFFFCIAILNNKPYKVFLIPDKYFPLAGCSIGWKSKYDKFIFPFS